MYTKDQLFDPDFWKTFSTDDYKFSVPEHWESMEPWAPIIQFQIQNAEEDDFALILQTTADKLSPLVHNKEQIVESLFDIWPKLIKDFKPVKHEWITDEHLPYFFAEYDSVLDEFDVTTRYYLWIVGRKTITFSMLFNRDAPEEVENFELLADLLLRLFKLKINLKPEE